MCVQRRVISDEEKMNQLKEEVADLLGAERVLRMERQDKENRYRRLMANKLLRRR